MISARVTWKCECIRHTLQHLPELERRQEKFGTRMERVPTTRWDILRDRVAIPLISPAPKTKSSFVGVWRQSPLKLLPRNRDDHFGGFKYDRGMVGTVSTRSPYFR